MRCLFSRVRDDQPTAFGTLYRCAVCGLAYRTVAPIERVTRECIGTAEQWAATRREQEMVSMLDALRTLRPDCARTDTEVRSDIELCRSCRSWRADIGCCGDGTCANRWPLWRNRLARGIAAAACYHPRPV